MIENDSFAKLEMRAVGVFTVIQSVRKKKKKKSTSLGLEAHSVQKWNRRAIAELFLCVEFMSNFPEC